MDTKESEALYRLFNAMKDIYGNICHDIDTQDEERRLKSCLKKAKKLNLKWKDIYELHQSLLNKQIDDRIAQLKKDGLEGLVIKKSDKNIIFKYHEKSTHSFNPNTPVKDVYESLFNIIKSYSECKKIKEKFPKEDRISLKNYNEAMRYFADNSIV